MKRISYVRNIGFSVKTSGEVSFFAELEKRARSKKKAFVKGDSSSGLIEKIRQHQIEQRREQQQSKGHSCDDMLGGKQRVPSKSKAGHECNSPQVSFMSQAIMKLN